MSRLRPLLLPLPLLLSSLFAQDEPAAVPAPAVEARLAEALQQAQLVYQPDPDGDCRLLLEFESGRSQQVFAMSGTEEFGGWELREIWSVAGSGDKLLDPANLELLLRANSVDLLGAWALRQVGEATTLVYRLQAPADCEPALLRRLIGHVARGADELERSLGGGDEY